MNTLIPDLENENKISSQADRFLELEDTQAHEGVGNRHPHARLWDRSEGESRERGEA